jgi:hypothetical protein
MSHPSAPLVVSAVLANSGSRHGGLDVAEALVASLPAIPVFQFRGKSGEVRADAFQWQAILGTAADLIELTVFFWALAEGLRKRMPESSSTAPFLVIFLRVPGGASKQLVVHPGDFESESFRKKLCDAAVEVVGTSPPEFASAESIIRKLEHSGVWVRIKPYDGAT